MKCRPSANDSEPLWLVIPGFRTWANHGESRRPTRWTARYELAGLRAAHPQLCQEILGTHDPHPVEIWGQSVQIHSSQGAWTHVSGFDERSQLPVQARRLHTNGVADATPSPVVDTAAVKPPPELPDAGRLEILGVVGVPRLTEKP